jgi:Mg2+/Co2+ transporter CorB
MAKATVLFVFFILFNLPLINTIIHYIVTWINEGYFRDFGMDSSQISIKFVFLAYVIVIPSFIALYKLYSKGLRKENSGLIKAYVIFLIIYLVITLLPGIIFNFIIFKESFKEYDDAEGSMSYFTEFIAMFFMTNATISIAACLYNTYYLVTVFKHFKKIKQKEEDNEASENSEANMV